MARWATGLVCGTLATAGAVSAGAAEPAAPRLYFTGNPSEVSAQGSAPCVTFQVRPMGKTSRFTLSTAGLGNAGLYHGEKCGPGPGSRSLVVATEPSPGVIDISLRPDLTPLRDEAAKLEGRIFATDAGGELATASLTVSARERPKPIIVQGFLWMIGIAIPAAIAFGVSRFAVGLDSARKERETFLQFATTRQSKIDTLMKKEVWLSLYAPQFEREERAGELWMYLSNAEIIGNLPRRARGAMHEAYMRNDPEALRARLHAVLEQYLPSVSRTIRFPVGTSPDKARST